MKIIKSINQKILSKSIKKAREQKIILPTFAQQKDPSKIPTEIIEKLKGVGLWEVNPINLFRITWHNEPVSHWWRFWRR